MRVSVTVKGDEAAIEHLDEICDRAQDGRPVFDEIGRILVADLHVAMRSGGRGRWPALAGGGRSRLTDTGEMYGSLQVVETDAHELRVGRTVPYAKYHEHGTSRMPARPLELSDRAHRKVVELERGYVVEGRGAYL